MASLRSEIGPQGLFFPTWSLGKAMITLTTPKDLPRRRPMAKLLMGCLLAIFFIAAGCGGARPYSLMYKSASSELSAPAQARDHRLKANLRAALVEGEGLSGLTLSPEVLMERGYVTGHVETPEQEVTIQRIARGVSGLR